MRLLFNRRRLYGRSVWRNRDNFFVSLRVPTLLLLEAACNWVVMAITCCRQVQSQHSQIHVYQQTHRGPLSTKCNGNTSYMGYNYTCEGLRWALAGCETASECVLMLGCVCGVGGD